MLISMVMSVIQPAGKRHSCNNPVIDCRSLLLIISIINIVTILYCIGCINPRAYNALSEKKRMNGCKSESAVVLQLLLQATALNLWAANYNRHCKRKAPQFMHFVRD
jgi:hypothetical protein